MASAYEVPDLPLEQRFQFGENWAAFLRLLNEGRIRAAERSLVNFLGRDSFAGMRFLDAGCGSGLFSLAARRLGASVLSFDFDPNSVGCAQELRSRYFRGDRNWIIRQGSVLDRGFLAGLGQFDIVYSWGVLHHTGAMWNALDNVVPLVADGGQLFIAIYNDQGATSRLWLAVKKLYVRLPVLLRPVLAAGACVHLWWRSWLKDLLRLRPFASWRAHSRDRGMSAWRDLVDWVGGYPFEVATREQIIGFYRQRGFVPAKVVPDDSLGCNQFVFTKHAC